MILFSSIFADTLETHGIVFAHRHYVKRGKMSAWEFRFWCKLVRGCF